MEQMTLRDPDYRKILQEHKEICLEMGFEDIDINEAIQELRNRGLPIMLKISMAPV